jgi:hypothetical protein
MDYTAEELEILAKANISVEDLEAVVTAKEMKKKKEPPVAIYTEKYEVAKNTCELCGTSWTEMFNMERYTDSSIRSKERVYVIPEGSKVETLFYTHKSCELCKEKLQLWDKDTLIMTILNDRRLIKKEG